MAKPASIAEAKALAALMAAPGVGCVPATVLEATDVVGVVEVVGEGVWALATRVCLGPPPAPRFPSSPVKANATTRARTTSAVTGDAHASETTTRQLHTNFLPSAGLGPTAAGVLDTGSEHARPEGGKHTTSEIVNRPM